MGEAGGDGGGVQPPGADGADVGVEVGEDWIGAAWEADGAGMVSGELYLDDMEGLSRKEMERAKLGAIAAGVRVSVAVVFIKKEENTG